MNANKVLGKALAYGLVLLLMLLVLAAIVEVASWLIGF